MTQPTTLHGPTSYPSELNIISLNCWGLKYLSKHRHARLKEIGVQIAKVSPRPDIVGLQECWTQQDYLSIRDSTQHILPYGKFYFSGIFGGGLAILSRWPIEESNMYRYVLNGRPTAFFRGDWFVGKGVACARIRMGPGEKDIAEVFCTHLHAPYEREPNDSYLCHRTAQAWEIAKLMRGAAERGHLVIGLGDFNMLPRSLAHRIIETNAPVKDIWRVLHPDSSIGAAEDEAERSRRKPVPHADYNIKENGTTCDSTLNTWRWSKQLQKQLSQGKDPSISPQDPDHRGKRLDYIFIGDSTPASPPAHRNTWRVASARVGFLQRHPTLRCSLSDHFSVEATLTRTARAAPEPIWPSPQLVSRPTLGKSVYEGILAVTHSYVTRELRQRKLRLIHFYGSVAVTLGCYLAVWWSPRNFVAFILQLIASLGLASGVLDGLIGGLFVSSELRALREFEWEVRNAMARDGFGTKEEDLKSGQVADGASRDGFGSA